MKPIDWTSPGYKATKLMKWCFARCELCKGRPMVGDLVVWGPRRKAIAHFDCIAAKAAP